MARIKKIKPEAMPEAKPEDKAIIQTNEQTDQTGLAETEKGKRSYELINHQADFTDRELAFLELHFEGRTTKEKAVFTAGYRNCSQRQRYKIAQNIIKKYEARAGGARNIFRDIGFGELTVAAGIKKLGSKSKSDIVKLRAHELAARALGMLELEERVSQGVTVIIQGPGAAVQVNAGQAAPTNPTRQAPAGIVTITE